MHPRESTTYVRGGWPHLPTRPCQRNSEHYLAGSFSTCDSAALFSAQISTNPLTSTLRMISDGAAAKGDVMAAARIAGIAAAKRTGDLIPLCHPLGLDAVSVTITPCEPDRVKILATTTTLGRTGVEMEALTAVSVAALTIYDMCKAVDRAMEISQIVLQEKSGGRSGVYRRSASDLACQSR